MAKLLRLSYLCVMRCGDVVLSSRDPTEWVVEVIVVRAGKSTRISAIMTVRSSLRGNPIAECKCNRENPLSFSDVKPVPQTDTRSRVEYTKALGRFTVKELGKLSP